MPPKPTAKTPLSRLRATGYIYSSRIGYAIGENIAWGTLWLATPRAIFAAWMASREHRANILDARFRDTAIGVSPHPLASMARGQSGAIYTQDFGVIVTGSLPCSDGVCGQPYGHEGVPSASTVELKGHAPYEETPPLSQVQLRIELGTPSLPLATLP
jgi:hypothetical protein